MSIKVFGYASPSPTADLGPLHFERRDPRPDDVVIDILYCGVCHSDLHTARNDWGGTSYPVVPGHEIVGRVTETGNAVKKFKPGDYVGVGCMVDSCGICPSCSHGEEQYCQKGATFTYNSVDPRDMMKTFGGYSTMITVTEKFVLTMPSGLDLKGAAPLLCAGITTWSPLKHWNVGKGTKVAVAGLGGLGHMAIKFAKALGAEVTLFTRSRGKEEDAYRLGADKVIYSTEERQMSAAKLYYDLIIDTIPNVHDLNTYIPTLSVNGTLVLVGYLGKLEQLNTSPMVLRRRSVAGSLIGGISETQEMLDFCGEHNISSDIEVIKMQDINKAYERMIKSDVKYRFVIDMASVKEGK